MIMRDFLLKIKNLIVTLLGMFDRLMRGLDCVALPVGIVGLIYAICAPKSEALPGIIITASALGFVYILYGLILFFLQRVKFDWHLLKGHFLRKVSVLVLLTPFVLYTTMHLINGSVLSAELTYDENLYKKNKVKESVTITDSLSMSILQGIASLHDAEISDGKLQVEKSNLPDRIRNQQENPSLFWSIYYHFIDPGNQHMTTSPRGRKWAALIGILGVFLLNGLLVSSIVGWVDSRKEKWLKGEVRYKCFLKLWSHYVIIGGNDMVAGIVRQLLNCSKSYILIQTNRDVETFRRELFTGLTEDEQKRIIVYYGSRTSSEDIANLMLGKAKEVYILGEDTRTDDIESYHDTMNMKCLELISDCVKNIDTFNKNTPLTCRVMFEYQTSFNILQVTDVDGDKIKFLPFNYYEMWAQRVLICQKLKDKNKCYYLPLEGFEGIKSEDDNFVHFVVVGMSRMGLAMAIEAAHLAHYPNFETKKKRTRITFIDTLMEQEKLFFMGRFKEMFSVARYREVDSKCRDMYSSRAFPWVDPLYSTIYKSTTSHYLGENFVDIEWEFLNGSVENPDIQKYLVDAAANEQAKLTIAVCLPENSRAIAAAAYLPDSVYESKSTIQVLVYQRLNDNLLSQINNNERYCKKLKAFGMASECYDSELIEVSEFMAAAVDKAYNQHAWVCMVARYRGTGMIDEDFDNLSGGSYSKVLASRADIQDDCKDWMLANNHTRDYSMVEADLKIFREQMNNKYSPSGGIATSKDKPKMARMWSNQYNIYTMWTKFRCAGIHPASGYVWKSPAILDELGMMEHNRWVVEQLLLRYRPLTENEQNLAKIIDLYSSTTQKRIFKNDFAHLDICSNNILRSVDFNVAGLDKKLLRILPTEYKKYLDSKKCR